jgi:hypothetical protein
VRAEPELPPATNELDKARAPRLPWILALLALIVLGALLTRSVRGMLWLSLYELGSESLRHKIVEASLWDSAAIIVLPQAARVEDSQALVLDRIAKLTDAELFRITPELLGTVTDERFRGPNSSWIMGALSSRLSRLAQSELPYARALCALAERRSLRVGARRFAMDLGLRNLPPAEALRTIATLITDPEAQIAGSAASILAHELYQQSEAYVALSRGLQSADLGVALNCAIGLIRRCATPLEAWQRVRDWTDCEPRVALRCAFYNAMPSPRERLADSDAIFLAMFTRELDNAALATLSLRLAFIEQERGAPIEGLREAAAARVLEAADEGLQSVLWQVLAAGLETLRGQLALARARNTAAMELELLEALTRDRLEGAQKVARRALPAAQRLSARGLIACAPALQSLGLKELIPQIREALNNPGNQLAPQEQHALARLLESLSTQSQVK